MILKKTHKILNTINWHEVSSSNNMQMHNNTFSNSLIYTPIPCPILPLSVSWIRAQIITGQKLGQKTSAICGSEG